MIRPAALGVIALTVLGLSACGVPTQTHPTRVGDKGVRFRPPVSSTSLPPGNPTRQVEFCLVSGDRLVALDAELPTPLTVPRTLRALIDLPPTALPSGTRSALNDPTELSGGDAISGIAPVALNTIFTDIPPADQILALAQIVCTLTSLPGVGQVQFTRDGRPAEVPRGDGSLTKAPVSRIDYRHLLPAT